MGADMSTPVDQRTSPEDLLWEVDLFSSEDPPQRAHGCNCKDQSSTVIIFDWDDTLLCSSVIHSGRQCSRKELQELERVIIAILNTAMGLGETLIVTNGNRTWVEDSARRYLPGLLSTLNKLTVVSARALYEAKYPKDPFMWKRAAFEHLLMDVRDFPGDCDLNLVVLGDQFPEIDAAHHVARLIGDSTVVKTVKFQEDPSVSDLIGQLCKVERSLGNLVNCEDDWNRGLVRREAPSSDMKHNVKRASGWRFSSRSESEVCVELGSLKEIWRLFF